MAVLGGCRCGLRWSPSYETIFPTHTRCSAARLAGSSPSPHHPLLSQLLPSACSKTFALTFTLLFTSLPLLRALQIMDTETQGFMTEDQLSKYLCEECEKFTPEEFEEMMSAAKDVDKGVIYYDEHAQLLALEDPQ